LTPSQHIYEIRPLKGKRGVDLISDTLPFGRLWHSKANAVDYAKLAAVRIQAVIRVYENTGNVIETHELADGVQRPMDEGCLHQEFMRRCFGTAAADNSHLTTAGSPLKRC